MTQADPHAPRRILIVENDYGNVGGSARAIARLVEHLDRDRYEIFVTFAHGSPSPMVGQIEALGAGIVRLGRRPMRQRRARRRGLSGFVAALVQVVQRWLTQDLPLVLELARVIRAHDFALVHANNNVVANRFVIWAAMLCRTPVVCHERFVVRMRPIDRLGLRYVSRVLCISRFVADDLARQSRPRSLQIVYDGVDVPERLPDLPRIGDDTKIAMLGRIVRWKGQHVLLGAIPLVLERFSGTRFEFVGAASDPGGVAYQDELRRLAEDLDVSDSVVFRGHVEDIDRRMREEYQIIVHCSVTPEPFGLVVAEGMAAGRPVVASGEGGTAEIIVHGESGLLFEPGNSVDLADKLISILEDPDYASRLGAAGWDRVSARFDARRTSREVAAVWEAVLGAPSSSENGPSGADDEPSPRPIDAPAATP